MFIAALLLLGCWVYCILAIVAAEKYARGRHAGQNAGLPVAISILKPLAGLDEGLSDNLRSFFEQDYRDFELLFAVREESDPAAALVRSLMDEYPGIRSRLILTGEPPYPHAKVFSLQCMLAESQYDLVAMSDSDVRVGLDFCRSIGWEVSARQLDLATCPYRAIPGKTVWSQLEAIGMNTDFHAGLFTAVMMEGTRFAVGPTIVARKALLRALGGMERVKDYLSSEDFMLGKIASEEGFTVALSSYVVEHRIGSETMLENFSHRLRWARTTRRSRPWGYIGQFFTYPVPIALLICIVRPTYWPLLAITFFFRATAAWIVSQRVLGVRVSWLLLPLQDLVGFGFWIAGFFGRSITWRGRRYSLKRDGTVELAG